MIPMVRVSNDGRVQRHDMLFEDMLKTLVWSEIEGKKRKTLPLRDLRLFWPRQNVSKSPYQRMSAIVEEKNRPAILPRPKVKCFLLDLGTLKLLCRSDFVDILYSKESDSHRRSSVNHFVQELRSSLSETLKMLKADSSCETLVFELQVLEAALSTTVAKFFRQLELVEPLLDGLVADTVSNPTEIKVGRLAALKKSIFLQSQKVQAITSAMKDLLNNNRDMADMYLDSSPREEYDHEEVEFLLEAYVADLAQIDMRAQAMIAHIDDTLQILELHLNARRNRIIRLSLILETFAVTTGTGAFIGSIFGMNLLSGFESHPTAFYWIVGGTGTFMISVLGLLALRFRHLVLNSPDSVENQHSALKHFFSYIEIIEAKVKMTDSISRQEFKSIVQNVVGNDVDAKEVDILFNVLDGNANNHLEFTELPPLNALRLKSSSPTATTKKSLELNTNTKEQQDIIQH